MLTVEHLLCEFQTNPIGLDTECPRLSWRLHSDECDCVQTAFRLEVSGDSDFSGEALLYDSGRTESREQTFVFDGRQVPAQKRCFWQVTVWDNRERQAVSAAAFWETGLKNTGWRGAEWIGQSNLVALPKNQIRSFSVSCDVLITRPRGFSLVFGATCRTDFFCLNLNCRSGKPVLSFSRAQHSKMTELCHCDVTELIGGCDDFVGQREIHVSLAAENGNVTAFLDGRKALCWQDEALTLGLLGFCNMRDHYKVRHLEARDAEGKVLFAPDFLREMPFEGGRADKDGYLITGEELVLQPYPHDGVARLRREFSCAEKPVSARLYATCAGIYEVRLNGAPVSDAVFEPGRTAFPRRVFYSAYDVTDRLQTGNNAIGVDLGSGWYAGAISISHWKEPAFRAFLQLTYRDGHTEIIKTDESWLYSGEGPIRMSDIWLGCRYDARRDDGEISLPSYCGKDWLPASVILPEVGEAVSYQGPRVVRHELLKPKRHPAPEGCGAYYDFGENFVGTIRIRFQGKRGDRVKLRFSEVLIGDINTWGEPKGALFTQPYWASDRPSEYILRGDSHGEVFEISLTYYGLRYLEIVSDCPAPLPEDITGIRLYIDTPVTGGFSCSNPLINSYVQNAIRSLKGNFNVVPTDCPQRSERYGWMGDASIFCRTGSSLMFAPDYYEKFVHDACDGQILSGGEAFPSIAPTGNGPSIGFSDAGIHIPYELYQQYGDRRVLEEAYPFIRRQILWEERQSPDGIYLHTAGEYGDWYGMREDGTIDSRATSLPLLGTAVCAESAMAASRIANVLEEQEDERFFAGLVERYRRRWRETYLERGRIQSGLDTQTAYVLGLSIGLFDEEEIPGAVAALKEKIERCGGHLRTGFQAVSRICPALSQGGADETAYTLMEAEDYPSWLYQVKMGATTSWEKWNSSDSRNHYAYASIVEWLIRFAAGIERDENAPGYRHFFLSPHPGGTLTSASSYFDCPYGRISFSWEKAGQGISCCAEIPEGTTATLKIPTAGRTPSVTMGGTFVQLPAWEEQDTRGKLFCVTLPSGIWNIR